MKISICTLVLIFLVSFSAAAQEVVVEYIDGILEIREDGKWYELYIGEDLKSGDTVRLAGDSFAELSAGNTRIMLRKPGTYAIDDLFKSLKRQETAGLSSLLGGRLKKMIQDDGRRETNVGGVRASEATETSSVTWAGGEEVGDLIADGRELLAAGDYREAFYLFEEAYDYSDPFAEDEPVFYLGYASALLGEYRDAFDYLTEYGPDSETEYYDDHVLVLSNLYLETLEYDQALDLLQEYTGSDPSDEYNLQTAYLFMGISYAGLQNSGRAEDYLKKAVSIDPDSEQAAAAARLLSDVQ